MPPVATLVETAQEALLLSIAVSLPVLAVALLVSLGVAVLGAITQVQDSTLAHLPRLVLVAVTLALAGPWMGARIASFALHALSGG